MKIYVASKFEDKEITRKTFSLLRKNGHSITCDWTVENSEGLQGNEKKAYMGFCAERDTQGVRDCDALLIYPHTNGRGEYTELGIAKALHKFIVVIGKPEDHGLEFWENIFLYSPNCIHVDTMEDAVKFINKLEENNRRDWGEF